MAKNELPYLRCDFVLFSSVSFFKLLLVRDNNPSRLSLFNRRMARSLAMKGNNVVLRCTLVLFCTKSCSLRSITTKLKLSTRKGHKNEFCQFLLATSVIFIKKWNCKTAAVRIYIFFWDFKTVLILNCTDIVDQKMKLQNCSCQNLEFRGLFFLLGLQNYSRSNCTYISK